MVTDSKTMDSRSGVARARQRVPAPDRLRGLAHPVRVRVLAALRTAGPSTATALAQQLGLNSGATSYHLRQLAAYGFIVEANDLGNRRDRYWKVPEGGEAPTPTARPERGPVGDVEARSAYLQARLVEQTDAAQAAIEAHHGLGREWSEVSDLSTHIVNLTPERAERLFGDIVHLIDEAGHESAAASTQTDETPGAGDGSDAAERADGTRPFVVQVQGFVSPAAG